ncbi:hypothetical protein GOP47_0013604 [Adiantum capillus-veneris]|uniref:non-specific serine/threonine protein kinase n=1 Tax=Adiantum capillus-veneris TaxID=13818 RepID=A0A9D4UNU5_ADICA|nr:hypothetical protein GOP47_0013604 [Adiantum capillus-veneris]
MMMLLHVADNIVGVGAGDEAGITSTQHVGQVVRRDVEAEAKKDVGVSDKETQQLSARTKLQQAFLVFCLIILAHPAPHQAHHAHPDPAEVASLLAIRKELGDEQNILANWVGDKPCGESPWTGVYCVSVDETEYIDELRLMNMNFTGTLAPNVGNFRRIRILNFMWNKLRGAIPSEIGKLSNLYLLLLNGNQFTGSLPPELGKLSMLNRLQIDLNNITGPVPSSFQGLSSVEHILLNNNSLTGNIPKELGQLPKLLHLLLDNNKLSGELPPELSNLSTLVILQLDNNNFDGSIPSSYSKLTELSKLSLRNCKLSGPIPNLSAIPSLAYLDLSQNRLSGTLPSLPSPSDNLTTIDLSFNSLNGEVPSDYFHFRNLDFLLLQHNSLDGAFRADLLDHYPFPTKTSFLLFNLQQNNFSEFIPGNYSSNLDFRFYGNPLCYGDLGNAAACLEDNASFLNFSNFQAATQVPPSCSENPCDGSRGEELVPGLAAQGQGSEKCDCAYPLVVEYRLMSPSFAQFQSYESAFIFYIASGSGLELEGYQVYVFQYQWEPGPRLQMTIKLFPKFPANEFEQRDVENLPSFFSSWKFPQNSTFGPYELLSFNLAFPYIDVMDTATDGKSLAAGALAGILIAAITFTAIVVVAIMLLMGKRWRRRVVVSRSAIRQHERLKIAGVRSFSYDDMARATNNFDDSMQIGQGGYGKVYRAVLDDGLVVAIKRAEVGSLQGSKEFVTEIDLLSRVHHRNLVSLVGYCDDQGEQMLVYEYMVNGTLRDHLNPQSKVPLDFPARLQIALGSAKGILYLHTEANPPIYHRDIKSSNILLDEKRRAKVADFGLSKLAPAAELEGDAGGYVSTVVKGTPGYLDPEYFLTHMLTDKSDVYSFGVVLLEMVTGLQPIYQGKNLVREVTVAKESGRMLEMVDSQMGTYPPKCMLALLELGISCCDEDTKLRPSMAEVVMRLVAIWQSTSLADSSMPFADVSLDMEAVLVKETPSSSNPDVSSASSQVSEGLFKSTIIKVSPR